MDLLHRDQGVILRLDRLSDATLRCSPSLRIPPLVSLGAVLLMCARRAAKPKLLQAERVTALISFAFPRQFVFSLALRFSWRDSSVLATGDSRFLAIPARRAVVWSYFNSMTLSKVGSWLLLVPPLRLV